MAARLVRLTVARPLQTLRRGVAARAQAPITIHVEGMMCSGCSTRVQELLEKEAAIASANVDLDKGLAVVSLQDGARIASSYLSIIVRDKFG